MSLDDRSTQILSQLLHSEDYVRAETMTEKLQISKRTLYYDLQKINGWLHDHRLSPVEHIRSLGLRLPVESKQKIPALVQQLDSWQYLYSDKERQAVLAIYLILRTNPVYLKDLMARIGLSRGTTQNEMNRLKGELSVFSLRILFHRKKGYEIEGTEQNKRKALLYYLSRLMSKEGRNHLLAEVQELLQMEGVDRTQAASLEESLSEIYRIMNQCEQELGIQITDETMHSLVFRLFLFSKRLQQGEPVELDREEKGVLKQTPEYAAARNISLQLEPLFKVRYPEDEIGYIAMNLLGAKVNYVNSDTRGTYEIYQLEDVIERMIDDFQRYACVFFQKRDLIAQNLRVHLKPTYYRMKYGLSIANPLTETVKKKYRDIFELTRKVVHHFEALVNQSVSDEEIAYLSMHFGGWMRNEGTQPMSRKKALIVCGSGVSTSRILQSQLEHLLPRMDIVSVISIREYEMQAYPNVDFIVSTVPIRKDRTPVFLVNAILTDTEKEMLLHHVNAGTEALQRETHRSVKTVIDIMKKYGQIVDEKGMIDELTKVFALERRIVKESRKPMLSELITEETIQIITEVADWKDAVRVAAEPLLRHGYIQDTYISAMIDNVLKLGPYIVIAPRIAIPHARPDQGVNRLGISLLCLKQSVSFSMSDEHHAHVIIVLAAVDKETHLKAIAQLTKLLSKPDNVDTLVAAESVEDIVRLVEQYSVN